MVDADVAPELHDFTDPPVTEVALAFGFLDIPGMHVGLIGSFWEKVRDDFPIVEHQPPHHMPAEPLEPTVAPTSGIEVLEAPPVPRAWFKSADETRLLQVQSNWFAFNWQKAGGDRPYPRYQAVEQQFRTYLSRFADFIEAEGLGDIGVTQCEVTYVNHIPLPGPGLSGLNHIIRPVGEGSGRFLPVPQQQRYGATYLISDADGTPAGRLHVSANPGFRKSDLKPILQLNLTARGYPRDVGENGIVQFLRLGREWVVRGFVDVTTPAMHQEWGLHA